MKIRNKVAVSRAGRFAVALAAICSSTTTLAAEFSGSVRVGATRSDNIRLAVSPNEESDTIYQISPSFEFTQESRRLDTTLRYQLQGYHYADIGMTTSYHQFDGALTADIVRETLWLEIGASRSQSIRDPDEVIPSGNLPISNNLLDRDEYYANPHFRKGLGRNVTVNADYRIAEVRYGDRAVQENTNESAGFSIENYKQGRGLTWAARYDWQKSEYDDSLPWEYRRASGELGFWLNGSTRVFGSGGEESAWDDPIDRSLQDSFWEAGFAFSSGERLRAEFAAGERSFGPSWRGELDFTFRRGSTRFSYAETPTTSGFNRFNRGGLIDPDQPDDFLDRPGIAERYISERLQWSLNLDFRRTGLHFLIFDEDRTGRFRADGTPIGDEAQRGGRVRFTWRAGARTELSASGSAVNRTASNTRDDDFVRGSLGASYRLGSATRLSLTYAYSEQDPAAGSTGRDYVANTVSLFLTYAF